MVVLKDRTLPCLVALWTRKHESLCPVALWNRKHVPGYSGTVSMWACAWFLSETGKEAQKSSKPTEKMHGNNDMQRAHVRPINRKERAHERSFQSV